MKTFLYVFFLIYGKLGKKVCIDIIEMVKIWKNTGKYGKNLSLRILPRFYPNFTITLSICRARILPFYQFYHQKYIHIGS